MKFYVAVTDHEWFNYLRDLPNVDEVNFWQPSPGPTFKALEKGDIFLFKLHRSSRTNHRDLIASGGLFAFYPVLPISLAWEAIEKQNGAPFCPEMRQRRHEKSDLNGDQRDMPKDS
jgi:putative restriction endonuclease